MRSFHIQDTRDFMKKLLVTDTFDEFQVADASITTFASFQINGKFHASYFHDQDADEFPDETDSLALWKRVRPFFWDLTKGRHTPLSFRIVLRHAPKNTEKLLLCHDLSLSASQVEGLYLNIRFDENGLVCTSGSALNFFTLDKSLDLIWDSLLESFFRQMEIPFC